MTIRSNNNIYTAFMPTHIFYINKDINETVMSYCARTKILRSRLSTNGLGDLERIYPSWKDLRYELKLAEFSEYSIQKIKKLTEFK